MYRATARIKELRRYSVEQNCPAMCVTAFQLSHTVLCKPLRFGSCHFPYLNCFWNALFS
jgi:hypothetical protein